MDRISAVVTTSATGATSSGRTVRYHGAEPGTRLPKNQYGMDTTVVAADTAYSRVSASSR
jgi:hypothetical protein